MKRKIIRLISVLTVLSLAFSIAACGGGKNGEEGSKGESLTFTETDRSDVINWYGRCYRYEDTAEVAFNLGASGFEVKFEGTRLTASIKSESSSAPSEAAGNTYLYAFVDGAVDYQNATRIELSSDGEPHEVVLCEQLTSGVHTVKVLKATEAKYGTARVSKITCDGKFISPPARPELKIELIGDSIMSGSECMRLDSVDSKLTVNENALASYGYIAAWKMLRADVTVVSQSGLTVSGGNETKYPKISDFYDKYSPVDDAEWDFTKFVPDIVVVDLGTNDSLIGTSSTIVKSYYTDFLRHLREKYPSAAIFCCYGAMVTSVNSLVSEVVESLGDANVYELSLPQISPAAHPKENDHLTNGLSLTGFINATLFAEDED